MWTRSDDPVKDYEAYDHDLHEDDWRYPICQICGERCLPGDEYVRVHSQYYHYDCTEHGEIEKIYEGYY